MRLPSGDQSYSSTLRSSSVTFCASPPDIGSSQTWLAWLASPRLGQEREETAVRAPAGPRLGVPARGQGARCSLPSQLVIHDVRLAPVFLQIGRRGPCRRHGVPSGEICASETPRTRAEVVEVDRPRSGLGAEHRGRAEGRCRRSVNRMVSPRREIPLGRVYGGKPRVTPPAARAAPDTRRAARGTNGSGVRSGARTFRCRARSTAGAAPGARSTPT